MILEKKLILKTTGLKSIVYDVCYQSNQTPKPVIIFCHGYKGFKDWGAWGLVAQAFAEAGFFFLKFNFSHNGGTVSQPIDFPDLEAFGQNNFSKELDDLESIINMVSMNDKFEQEVDAQNISLIAHSRGGGIILIKAEENTKIKNVITWAGVSDFKTRFQENTEGFKQWKKTGITFVENGRTKQQMPHSFQFYEDFIANEERLTISRAVKNLKIPFLIVHGSEDKNVLLDEAKSMYRWNSNSKLEIINNADHVFGSGHPWMLDELPPDLKKAVNFSINFVPI